MCWELVIVEVALPMRAYCVFECAIVLLDTMTGLVASCSLCYNFEIRITQHTTPHPW